MRVVCVINVVSDIADAKVRERLSRSIHIDGPITDLTVGREYTVQAIEEWDSGELQLYLHTVSVSGYPYPWPAELFEVRDNSMPLGWCVYLQPQQGRVRCKRITFAAWATDDNFYERLVDGDPETVSVYRRFMATS